MKLDDIYGEMVKQGHTLSDIEGFGFFESEVCSNPVSQSLIDLCDDYDSVNIIMGGFSPCHKGHVQGLIDVHHETALSVFVLSHPTYTCSKKSKLSVQERMDSIEMAVRDTGLNVYIESFNAIHGSHELNFTNVLLALKDFKHKVCFVFGSDNSGFASACDFFGVKSYILQKGDDESGNPTPHRLLSSRFIENRS